MKKVLLLFGFVLAGLLGLQAQSYPDADTLCLGTSGDTSIRHIAPGVIQPSRCGTNNGALGRLILNETSTGTVLNKLAKLTGNPSSLIIAATTDTANGTIVGVVAGNAGTSGLAAIVFAGTTPCVFDNATTAGDFVTGSTSVAGDCHDFGATTPSDGSEIIGRVLVTNASVGTNNIGVNAGLVGGGNGGGLNFNLISGNKASLAADFTDANSAALQVITGLAIPLPTIAGSYSFHCQVSYTQATAVAGDQFGVAVLTTAPTRLDAFSIIATNATAVQQGLLNNLTTTTPTAVVTFTPAVTTQLVGYLDGTAVIPGGAASTLQIYVLNGTAANVIVVKAGSFCTIS